MRLSFIALLSLVVLCLSAASNSFAAGKIAVIDLERIYNETKAYRSLDRNVKKEREKLVSRIKITDAMLKKRKKAVFKDKDKIPEEIFTRKAQAYNKLVTSSKTRFNNEKNRITSAMKEANEYIRLEIKNIVSVLAKRRGFDVAVPKSVLTFATSDLDITDDVIARLNRKISTVNIKK